MITMCAPQAPTVVPPAVSKLRERLQQQSRERAVLERALQRIGERTGQQSQTIRIDHPLAAPPGSPAPSRLAGDGDGKAVATGSSPYWPRAQFDKPATLKPTPGLACYAMKERCEKIVGVWVVGLSDEELVGFLRTIAQQQIDENNFVPIFFTDSTAFNIFREHGFVFEYLPGEELRTRGAVAWDQYVQTRLAHAVAMWGITHMTGGPNGGPPV
jgi:hypothetical protein